MELSRREILQIGGLSALAVAGVTLPFTGSVVAKSASQLDDRLMPRPYRAAFTFPPVLRPVETGVDDVGRFSKYVLNQTAGTARFLTGVGDTPVWGYGGRVAGPTIHSEAGGRVSMRMRNRLPETHPIFGHTFNTSTHLHGNASLPEYDGYASDLTRPGFTKTYQWPNSFQPARTLFYHDHAVTRDRRARLRRPGRRSTTSTTTPSVRCSRNGPTTSR